MKIPQFIRNTSIFKNIRRYNHKINDSINLYKYKYFNSINNSNLENSDTKTKDQLDTLYSNIIKNYEDKNIREYPINKPLISIIIVDKDNSPFLKDSLLSISNIVDYYENIEVILVVNKSIHEEIKDKYKSLSIKLIDLDTSLSFSDLNNMATNYSNGEYLLFMDTNIKTPIKGVLNHLLNVYNEYDDVGAVTCQIIYESEDINKKYRIHSQATYFRNQNNNIQAYYRNHNKYPETTDNNSIDHVVAVPRYFFLIKKAVFTNIGRFSNDYKSECADLDLSLKLHYNGFKNYYTSMTAVFINQYEDRNFEIDYKSHDYKVFLGNYEKELYYEINNDKLESNMLFSEESLNIGLVVTEYGSNSTAGDYFTALELSSKLEDLGWNTSFYAQRSKENWYFVNDDIDVLIVLLERYDINKIQSNNKNLVKIAWLRNWFDEWISSSYFKDYDITLASSQTAVDLIKDKTSKDANLFPLATDTTRFNNKVKPVDKYRCDYCFTGSYWNVDRDIIDALDPDSLDYSFNLYGENWDKIPKLQPYNRGFVSYEDMPEVYASCKIVLDDANITTKKAGSVNSRVFDAISSNKLVITNNHIGNNELFDSLIPEYNSKNELQKHLETYLKDPKKKDALVSKLRKKVIENHTYTIRAEKLKSIISNFYM